MMHSLNSTGMSGTGTTMFLLHFHWIFISFVIVGFILLTSWALKNLTGKQLQSLAIWILTIGILGSLITAPFAAKGIHSKMNTAGSTCGIGNSAMCDMEHMQDQGHMEEMMKMMMDHDEVNADADHEMMQDKLLEMKQGMSHDQAGNVRTN